MVPPGTPTKDTSKDKMAEGKIVEQKCVMLKAKEFEAKFYTLTSSSRPMKLKINASHSAFTKEALASTG